MNRHTYKALALGAVLGFLASVAPSCGGAAPCGPLNCSTGCCDSTKPAGSQCVTGTNGNNLTCGTAGLACVDCTKSGSACSAAFKCVGGGGTGGGSAGTGGGTGVGGGSAGTGGGTGTNCPGLNGATGVACANGCCSGTQCLIPQFQNANGCGLNAVTCTPCQSGQACTAGACTGGAGGGSGGTGGGTGATGGGTGTGDGGTAGKLGSPCTTAADCNMLEGTPAPGVPAGQSGAICKLFQTVGGAPYPGGICTKRCISDAACGPTSACQYGLGFTGELENLCMPRCAAGQCRAGFTCLNFGSTAVPDPICLLKGQDGGFFDLYDAGPPAGPGVTAGACTTDNQCRPPDEGFCDPEFLPDGGLTGIPGGQCGSDCSMAGGSEFCGDGGTCILFLFNTNDGLGQLIGGLCQGKCIANADGGQDGCRAGFGCDPLGPAGTTTGPGFCVSRCNNPGNGCPQGQTCNLTTGLCN